MSTEEKKIVDLRAEALKYMSDHKVQILFDYLGAKLAKDKPQNPNEYLIQELVAIQDAQAAQQPVTLFSKEDIEILFTTFDLTGRGFITPIQYRNALQAVGLKPDECAIPSLEAFDKSTFVNYIYKEVLKNSL